LAKSFLSLAEEVYCTVFYDKIYDVYLVESYYIKPIPDWPTIYEPNSWKKYNFYAVTLINYIACGIFIHIPQC
jgi:hypothetical protein